MAGQQPILNFLKTPPAAAPGKAAPTQVLPPGPKVGTPSPQQKKAAAEAKDQQRAAEREAKELDKANQKTAQVGLDAITPGVKGMGEKVSGWASGLTSWAESVPKPGGIGLLLLAIFFLIWAVVPVNSGNGAGPQTRLGLLWLTFMGRTRMAASPDAGGTYDPTVPPGTTEPAPGGSGGGIQSNGHVPLTVSDLMSTLNIRDFGGNV